MAAYGCLSGAAATGVFGVFLLVVLFLLATFFAVKALNDAMSPSRSFWSASEIDENCFKSALLLINLAVRALFMVDQKGKGVLGRMVAAYGQLNDSTIGTSAPAPDVEGAFRSTGGTEGLQQL